MSVSMYARIVLVVNKRHQRQTKQKKTILLLKRKMGRQKPRISMEISHSKVREIDSQWQTLQSHMTCRALKSTRSLFDNNYIPFDSIRLIEQYK